MAIDAINAAGSPHCFLSVTKWGHSAIVRTAGNKDCHIILRGGKEPNYSAEHVAAVKEGLKKQDYPKMLWLILATPIAVNNLRSKWRLVPIFANKLAQEKKL